MRIAGCHTQRWLTIQYGRELHEQLAIWPAADAADLSATSLSYREQVAAMATRGGRSARLWLWLWLLVVGAHCAVVAASLLLCVRHKR